MNNEVDGQSYTQTSTMRDLWSQIPYGGELSNGGKVTNNNWKHAFNDLLSCLPY